MSAAEWWREAVIYQVYPRSFADADGNGVGDLAGVRAHLDHLVDLGVDAVWLSPFYPSPMKDNGYDVSEYCDVDPLFGTLEDFDALIADLHDRDIRVVIDLVLNHTSDQHPWFLDARAGGPKRDWYFWRREPNNWGSYFSGSAWTLDEPSGEYYLHLFTPEQPDLNWDNPEVRAAAQDVMRWWLDRGVDGFRLDVINAISKQPGLPDAEVPEGEVYGRPGEGSVDGPRVHEYLAELRREVLGDRRDILLLGETPSSPMKEANRYTDPARGELDLIITFDHVEVDHGANKWDLVDFPLSALKRTLARWQEELHPGWNCLYWSNHDQPRIVSRFGDDGAYRTESAKALAAALHLLRGTPLVYQGEEIAMANFPFTDVAQFDDYDTLNHLRTEESKGATPAALLATARRISRDNARTPMQWDGSLHAGFTRGTPWLAVNPDHSGVNVAVQRDDKESVLAWYRALIDLRHTEPAVAEGDFALLAAEDEQVFAFRRSTAGTTLVLVTNFSSEPAALPADVTAACRGTDLVLGTEPGDVLAPWHASVHRRYGDRPAPDPRD